MILQLLNSHQLEHTHTHVKRERIRLLLYLFVKIATVPKLTFRITDKIYHMKAIFNVKIIFTM